MYNTTSKTSNSAIIPPCLINICLLAYFLTFRRRYSFPSCWILIQLIYCFLNEIANVTKTLHAMNFVHAPKSSRCNFFRWVADCPLIMCVQQLNVHQWKVKIEFVYMLLAIQGLSLSNWTSLCQSFTVCRVNLCVWIIHVVIQSEHLSKSVCNC